MTVVVQDSNDVLLSICEESTIGVLPGTPVWQAMEPNTIGDFGGEPSLVSRAVIGTRKPQKGSITGIAPKATFNNDFTKNNMQKLLQGFVFADISQKFSTLPINGSQVVMTSVAASDKSYNAASGLGTVLTKHLLLASGFTNSANNGLKTVATVAAGKITVSETLVDEASPPAAAKLEVVGAQFASGDITFTYAAPVLTMVSSVFDFTTLNLTVGGWMFIGGDSSTFKPVTIVPGYARVASVAAHAIVFDKTTFTPVADAGTAKTLQIFFGNIIKDVALASIVRRTYQLERQLGSDGVATQAEYLIGSVANELTMNFPKKDKIAFDLGYIGLNHATVTGTVGVKSGTRVSAAGDKPFNTSSDIYRACITSVDPLTLNPTPYFGYITSFVCKINNNAVVNESLGSVGGFEINVGEFEVTATVEAYFTTNAAITAVRAVTDSTIDIIAARNNHAFVLDLPLVEMGGGLAKVEKNKPIMLPITANSVQSTNGYCFLANFLPYVPTVAMPTQLS